jgi:hypothetical protein
MYLEENRAVIFPIGARVILTGSPAHDGSTHDYSSANKDAKEAD